MGVKEKGIIVWVFYLILSGDLIYFLLIVLNVNENRVPPPVNRILLTPASTKSSEMRMISSVVKMFSDGVNSTPYD